MRFCFKTVLKEAEAEITEKKSRFIASVKNISSEEEAVKYLEEVRKKYWDATHNVYAYYIGADSTVQKCSDDGEPSGTAGVPVLEAIRREQVEDVIVIVSRYFGGTLLGTGGLARAYARSAREGLAAAGIVKKIFCSNVSVTISYTLVGKVQNLISENKYCITKTEYSDMVNLIVAVPVNDVAKFEKQINEFTSGDAAIIEVSRGYYIIEKTDNIDNREE